MDLLALNVLDLWGRWIGPILLFVVGLGLVVFVHELGHFLVAKWVGIKVERFALGFGPRLFGIKRGETDYCIRALPLGGYTKMLGQEDFAPLDETAQLDPRSFAAKSVGARFAVISAGVIMNVIFAAVLFVIIGMVGKEFLAPVVGSADSIYPGGKVQLAWRRAQATTQPTAPAAAQVTFGPGLRPGDKLLKLDGKKLTRFQDLEMTSVLAAPDDVFEIVVQRRDEAGQKWIGTGKLPVKKSRTGDRLIFGIRPAADTVFEEPGDVIAEVPFRKNDRLLAINGRKIEDSWQIGRLEKTLDGREVTVTVERRDNGQPRQEHFTLQPLLTTRTNLVWLKDGRRGEITDSRIEKEETFFRISLADGTETELEEANFAGGGLVEALDILGMIPRLWVGAVLKGSRADQGGLLPGDIIVGYGDRGAPTFRQFKQITLKAAGLDTQITVLRNGKQQALTVKPKRRKERAEIGIYRDVDLMHTVLAGVREGSPAARVGLAGGDVIKQINGREVRTWIDAFNVLKELSGREVTITYRRGAEERTAEIGKLDPSIFDPDDYVFTILPTGAMLKPLMVRIVKRNPIHAVAWGTRETVNFIATTYATLRSIIRGWVSTDALVGPIGIGGIAVRVGRTEQPLINFVYFMAFISSMLAVFNFLPLPVVDGGHAVFLLIEKIRRKPLPLRVINIAQLVGLALIILAFVLLTWQDIGRLMESRW